MTISNALKKFAQKIGITATGDTTSRVLESMAEAEAPKEIILRSASYLSDKTFKITVLDNGEIRATEIEK